MFITGMAATVGLDTCSRFEQACAPDEGIPLVLYEDPQRHYWRTQVMSDTSLMGVN